MHIRQKGRALRVTVADTSMPQSTPYILIEPATCWNATFNAWGKKIDAPILDLAGKRYRVVFEQIYEHQSGGVPNKDG